MGSPKYPKCIQSKFNMMKFVVICELFEEVHKTQGLSNKSEILKRGFAKIREDTNFNIQGNFEKFYQAIRLIVPGKDHGRKTYNMKENRIARTIIKMLNLGDGNDKKTLLGYNKVSSISCISIDFAHIVHTVLRKYISAKQSSITVLELNNDLDLIANRDSDSKLDEIMLAMIRKLTSLETKWIIRVMLKNLKLGIDDNRILRIFHPDAVEYYSSNNNLMKMCETLWNPAVSLNELNLALFEPFQPMLSKRCDARSFMRDFLENKKYFVETKFDGERFQLHMENGKFKYFSRNGYDYTNEFGEDFKSGTLTQKLKGVFHDNIKNFILDGEMMIWHKKKRKFGSKGMTLDVKKLKVTNDNYQPCFCVFDILLLNDRILTKTELAQRLKLLSDTVKSSIEGTILISQYQESSSRQNIINILNRSMDNEEEGIVVKDPKSIYKYKDRKSGWYKIKMEYFEDVVTDMDLILMGGYYKANSKELKSFLVGVFSSDKDKCVLSFGKVSSGLNWEESEIVSKKFSEAGISREQFQTKTEGKLHFGKDIPDVLLEPKNALIFTVRATELIRCTDESFRTSYTIRFPRILKLRSDKSYEECLSIGELLELCQKNKAVIKLNKRHLELEEITTVSRPKKQKVFHVDVESLKRSGNILCGMKFFVMTDKEGLPVGKIEELVGRYGGTFSLHLEEGINIVLVGIVTPKVQDLLKEENKFDIILVQWLQRVTTANRLLKYRQNEVLRIGTSYYNCLTDDLDMYGDSYTEETDPDALRSRLEYMSGREHMVNLNNSIMFKADLPLFNKFIAYFDTHEIIGNSDSKLIYNSFLDEVEFRYRLGTVSNTLCSAVNLVVVGSRNEERIAMLEKYASSINCRQIQVIEKSQLLSEDEF